MIGDALLRRIPGCEQGNPPLRLRALPGGRGVNRVLGIVTRLGRFVLRQRLPPLRRPGADPEQELQAHRLASRAGLAPWLFDAAPDGAWILMEYVDSPAWTPGKLLSPEGLAILCGQIQALHGLPVPASVRPFDPLTIAGQHIELVLRAHPEQNVAVNALLARIQAAVHSHAEESARLPAIAPVLNHGDLQAPNILGSAALLADWEYAQWADPAWDIAVLLIYHPQLRPRSRELLEAAGLPGAGQQARLTHLLTLFAALNELWTLAEYGPIRV
ncbi:MAG: phosphotransferase [Nevskiaceae bacterium]|nr:phosphotransferase [Nevskiaceae bacterium]